MQAVERSRDVRRRITDTLLVLTGLLVVGPLLLFLGLSALSLVFPGGYRSDEEYRRLFERNRLLFTRALDAVQRHGRNCRVDPAEPGCLWLSRYSGDIHWCRGGRPAGGFPVEDLCVLLDLLEATGATMVLYDARFSLLDITIESHGLVPAGGQKGIAWRVTLPATSSDDPYHGSTFAAIGDGWYVWNEWW